MKFFKFWLSTKIPLRTFVLITILGFVADQITKLFTIHTLVLDQSKEIIPRILAFHYVQNTGASFSILPNATLFLTIFSIIVAILIILCYKKIPEHQRLFFAFILAGTLGNLLDRIRFGYVVDFLDFKIWPVFNLADSFVTLGALSLVYMLMKEK